MSFALAHQVVQKFIIDKKYSTPRYESIDAVIDAASLNTTIVAQDLGPDLQVGKNRTLKISYYPIDCDAAADDCNQNLCDTGAVNDPVQEFFTLSRCIATKPKRLRVQDVRDVDGNWGFSAHAMAQINAGLGSARKALAEEIDTLLLANAGLQLDGNATHRVTMTNTATGVLQPVGLWEIEQDFNDGGFTNPFIIGSKEVFQWKKALGIATDNTTTGQALARLGATNMYYDTILNSVAGNTANGEHIIAFDPQALRFIAYNKNVGVFATELVSPEQLDTLYKRGGTDYIKGIFLDPVTGLYWDFYLNFNKCEGDDGAFDWYFKLNWDIFFPKIQACNRQGVNGILHYRTCPVVIPTCPTGDTPSPAVNPVTYSWTPPGGTTFVGNITLGGTTSQPAMNVASVADWVSLFNDVYGNIFTVSGGNIHYSGNVPITGNVNNGDITITFA